MCYYNLKLRLTTIKQTSIMKLLLISNSTNAGEAYLEYTLANIKDFLGNSKYNCIFIPYAAVDFTFDEYETKVKTRFEQLGYSLNSIHHFTNKQQAIEKTDVIVVGGGNTFCLLDNVQKFKLIEPIRKKVFAETPYIGWSAGSNLVCPTIKTTNDMPIVEPESFNALNLIDYQINPHYIDANPDGHAGETREQRINEFLVANKNTKVLGLREGTMIKIINEKTELLGNKTARLFSFGNEAKELEGGNIIIN